MSDCPNFVLFVGNWGTLKRIVALRCLALQNNMVVDYARGHQAIRLYPKKKKKHSNDLKSQDQ